MSPGTPANNIAVRFLLHGPVRHELVREALREIVRRHEVLRTRFVRQDGEPKQLVEQTARFELPLDDLRDRPAEIRAAEAERMAVEEACVGFNLATGPLFRGRLIQTGDEEYTLLLTIHHIVSDGWSVGIISDELGAIYESLATQTPCSLPPLPIQYADYACWQEQWVADGELDKQLEYWKQKLSAFEPLDIPTDTPRPATPINRGEIRSIVLSRRLTDALKEVSDRHGCTLFMTMMSAFVALLRHESRQNDILVRTLTAGRQTMELEPLIGWFVNSIVLRSHVSGDPAFEALLKQVQETVLAAFEHQNVPFERLIEIIRPAQPLGRRPPFQVNFIFQRDFVKPWQRCGITFTPIPSKATGTFVDLNFFLVERKDGWRASVDVNLDVFHPETGEYFLQNFETVLETVAKDSRIPLSQIPLRTRSGIERKPDAAGGAVAEYVAPRNALEARVAAIWERALGIAPIGVYTNFFDLGGHSLLAVRIVTAIEKEFGQQIKLAHLFVNPTVAAMAQILEGVELPKQDVVLIPVQPNGSRPPLFMVGGDHWFRPLARRLSPDQPLLGLSLQAYEGRLTPTPFEEIAAELAAKIITIQPEGPYYLSGWCVDGAVAFAVASHLLAEGRTVGLVVLIDCLNPEYRREYNSRVAVLDRAMRRTRLLLREAKEKSGRGAGRSWTSTLVPASPRSRNGRSSGRCPPTSAWKAGPTLSKTSPSCCRPAPPPLAKRMRVGVVVGASVATKCRAMRIGGRWATSKSSRWTGVSVRSHPTSPPREPRGAAVARQARAPRAARSPLDGSSSASEMSSDSFPGGVMKSSASTRDGDEEREALGRRLRRVEGFVAVEA